MPQPARTLQFIERAAKRGVFKGGIISLHVENLTLSRRLRWGTERCMRNRLQSGNSAVFPYSTKAEPAPSGAAGVVQDGKIKKSDPNGGGWM